MTAIVRISTSDHDWIRRHAAESEIIPCGTDLRGVMHFQADVKVWAVERVKFAGAAMIHVKFITSAPADQGRDYLYPESRLIEEES